MSRQANRFVLLLRYGFVLLWLFAAAGCGVLDDQSQRDADLVYCLDTDHHAELVEAGAALGLVRPGGGPDQVIVSGRRMDIQAWRKARGSDFERTCSALAGSARPEASPVADNGLDTITAVLLPVLAGALLSWLSAEWRARAVTAQLEADNLRSAVRAYVNACDILGRAWSETLSARRPDDEPVRRRHDDLDAQLRRCAVLHRRWKALTRRRRDLAELTADTLREDQPLDWNDLSDDARPEYARQIKSRLEAFEAGTEHIAEALERPWRLHRAMRRPPADPPVPTAGRAPVSPPGDGPASPAGGESGR